MPKGVRLAGKEERDYVKHVVDNQAANEEIAAHVGRTIEAGEWPTIVFVQEIEHARKLAALIIPRVCHGVPVVSSKTTTPSERAGWAERMRRGDPTLKVVVATDVWGTGIDIPNLMSGHNAGDLQAPIGLRQQWYDYVRSGVSRYAEHAKKRAGHYERAGFDLSPVSQQLMQQVLQQPVAKPPLKHKDEAGWHKVAPQHRWLIIFYPPFLAVILFTTFLCLALMTDAC
jgi:hypothetical protein